MLKHNSISAWPLVDDRKWPKSRGGHITEVVGRVGYTVSTQC